MMVFLIDGCGNIVFNGELDWVCVKEELDFVVGKYWSFEMCFICIDIVWCLWEMVVLFVEIMGVDLYVLCYVDVSVMFDVVDVFL